MRMAAQIDRMREPRPDYGAGRRCRPARAIRSGTEVRQLDDGVEDAMQSPPWEFSGAAVLAGWPSLDAGATAQRQANGGGSPCGASREGPPAVNGRLSSRSTGLRPPPPDAEYRECPGPPGPCCGT